MEQERAPGDLAHGDPERAVSLERERERAALYDELRAIEQQIAQLVDHIRRAAGKAVEKVKELVRGPQPEPAAPSAEPPKAEIAAARKEVIHDAAVLANHYRSLRAEIQKERAERQAARAEVLHLAEDVQHLRSWLVTVFLTWGLVVAVVGALLAGMMNQLTRSLWAAFLVWWNS